MFTLSMKMPEELAGRVSAAARRRGVSRSALIRAALELYLGQAGGGDGTAADLAGELMGAVEGPRDLSRRPERLERSGR